MTPFALRAATDADVDAIAVVWHAAWRDGHLEHVPPGLLAHRTPASFRARVPARIGATTVGVIGGAIAGFVVVDADEVEELFVAASARGTGLATALLACGERAVADGYEVAWLAVVAGNARARRFYEREGWADAGPIAYEAETTSGTFVVPSRRYEKWVRPDA